MAPASDAPPHHDHQVISYAYNTGGASEERSCANRSHAEGPAGSEGGGDIVCPDPNLPPPDLFLGALGILLLACEAVFWLFWAVPQRSAAPVFPARGRRAWY